MVEQTWAVAGTVGEGFVGGIGKKVSVWRAQVFYSNILGKV